MEQINGILIDFTEDNIKAHVDEFTRLTSGNNLDIIQFKDGELCQSPFVKQIEFFTEKDYGTIEKEQISRFLNIEVQDLFFYEMFYPKYGERTIGWAELLNSGLPGSYRILQKRSTFDSNGDIFEIRLGFGDHWTSWQAISGKFLIMKSYRFGPGGIQDIYSSINERNTKEFSESFQMRYSGKIASTIAGALGLPRIINDPYNAEIKKVIDTNTFEILFDSLYYQVNLCENSDKIWMDFQKRYANK